MQRFPRQTPEIVRSSSVTCFLIAIFLFSSLAAAAADRKPKEFVEGLRAFDMNQLEDSAKLMAVALEKLPEDGEPVRLYGTRFEPYLPQFYRGLAFYKLGSCQEALTEWRACISTGAVLKTNKYEPLLRYLFDCEKRLSGGVPPKSGSS